MIIRPDSTVLFTGDSITDAGREKEKPEPNNLLGRGYVSQCAASLLSQTASPALTVHNRGMSGNRIYDLEERLQADLLDLKPDVISILIGINDTWRRFDSNLVSETADYKDCFSRILSTVTHKLDAQVVLLEPFVLPVPEDRRSWRMDLDPRINAVRELAVDFGAELIPLDGIFAEAATRAPAEFWLPDGVHPSLAGHALIAEAWLKRAVLEE